MARDLVVRIVGDSSSLERSLKRSEKATRQFGVSVAGLGRTAVGFAGITSAAILTGRAIRGAFSELAESERVTAQTNAVLKSTGGVANVTAEQVRALGDEVLRYSGIDDEAVRSAANLLLTFKQVRNEVGEGADIFNRATKAAVDLSVAGFGDLSSTAKQLGKALNDPIRGTTALRRAGVTFTAAQEATIRSLVETGRALEAQKIILKEVESQVGGSAAAFGDTLPGKVAKAQESLKNLGATILEDVAPAIEKMADGLNSLLSGDATGGATINLPLNATIDQVRKVREELARVGGEGSLAVKALDKTIEHMNATLFHTLDTLESLRAQRFPTEDQAGGRRGIDLPETTLPFRIRQLQAQGETVASARAVKEFIDPIVANLEAIIESGRLQGKRLSVARKRLLDATRLQTEAQETIAAAQQDAAAKTAAASKKHADAVRNAAEKQEQAAKDIAAKLREATDQFRNQIGPLFGGLPDDVLRAQRRRELGLPGIDPRSLVTGLRDQTAAFAANQRNLARLARAGAPSGLIAELQGRGLEVAPQIAALAGASRQIQRQFFQAFKQREAAARKAAERPINLNVQVFLKDSDITDKVIVQAQKKARQQGGQRRGRHGGQKIALG